MEEEQKQDEKQIKTDNKVSENNKETDRKVNEETKRPTEEKKEEKFVKETKKKKTEAVVYGKDLPISTKHSIAICDFIRGKTVEKAVSEISEVLRFKRAIPMKLEIPHRKGKGMERGRYPINAVKQFIKLLKQLTANAIVNEMELEKCRIECKADRASRPYKRFGSGRFKRSHVTLKLKENKKQNKTKGEKK